MTRTMLGLLVVWMLTFNAFGQVEIKQFPLFKGEYFGQKSPGVTPELFVPKIFASRYSEKTPTFSPDGNEVYWEVSFLTGVPNVILFSRKINNVWTKPQVASFSGLYSDGGPSFSPDGKKIFFHSNRPISGNEVPKDFDIWFVERINGEWSLPINVGKRINSEKSETYPSISKKGTLFFNSFLEGYPSDIGIYASHLVNGEYKDRTLLDENINTKTGFTWCPFVDPEEKYLLFSSGRDGQEMDDLYCSFMDKKGSWTKPIKLKENINTDFNERFPKVSPDGRFLFFSRPLSSLKNYYTEPQTLFQLLEKYDNLRFDDIYWLDAKIIEDLKSGKER